MLHTVQGWQMGDAAALVSACRVIHMTLAHTFVEKVLVHRQVGCQHIVC